MVDPCGCNGAPVLALDSATESSLSSATDQSTNGLDGTFVGGVELREDGYYFDGKNLYELWMDEDGNITQKKIK